MRAAALSSGHKGIGALIAFAGAIITCIDGILNLSIMLFVPPLYVLFRRLAGVKG